jgi:predicted NBD/HSP70 family sugar kinase
MNNDTLYSSDPLTSASPSAQIARKGNQLLRLIRAAQPITRTEIAERLSIDKSTVTENVKPLVQAGVILEESIVSETLGRKARVLSFADDKVIFGGVNFGVRRSQVGLTTLGGDIIEEEEFETPTSVDFAIHLARTKLDEMAKRDQGRELAVIGVSVPGMTDADRQKLVFAPNLGWRDVDIAAAFRVNPRVRVVVDNDASAAAMYEARLKIKGSADGLMSNFILVRSGTGIGVGLVIGSEVYRGSGSALGIAGEFGHMTIVAGGRPCVCGNRGCWEKYASAASAATLYLGDRPPARNESVPRFVDIVAKAEVGDVRSRKTLEKIGDYLGIGIANVIMGVGIPRVIISGRLVYGWKFIEEPLVAAVNRSIVGQLHGWTVEAGEPAGSAIGGALEIAVEEYLSLIV